MSVTKTESKSSIRYQPLRVLITKAVDEIKGNIIQAKELLEVRGQESTYNAKRCNFCRFFDRSVSACFRLSPEVTFQSDKSSTCKKFEHRSNYSA